MTRAFAAAALTCTLLASPALAAGPCAEFEVQGNGLRFTMDPFEPELDNRPFTVRVTRKNNSITHVRFVLVDVQTNGALPKIGRGGPDSYHMVWREDPSRRVFMVQNGVVSDANGALAKFERRSDSDALEFELIVPRGQPASPIDEDEALEVRYECFAGGERVGSSFAQRDNRVAFDLRVRDRFEAGLGDTSKKFSFVSFGRLDGSEDTVTRSIDLAVKSTSGYSVSVTSNNGGGLSRIPGDETIPYKMTLGGERIESGSECRFGRTPAPSGARHPLAFELDATKARALRSGAYGDIVTLVLWPRDGSSKGCTGPDRG